MKIIYLILIATIMTGCTSVTNLERDRWSWNEVLGDYKD